MELPKEPIEIEGLRYYLAMLLTFKGNQKFKFTCLATEEELRNVVKPFFDLKPFNEVFIKIDNITDGMTEIVIWKNEIFNDDDLNIDSILTRHDG